MFTLRRGIIAAAVAGGTLAVLAVGSIIWVFVAWPREFDRRIEALEKEGAVLDPGGFSPAPLPDAENAAPLYLEAFALLEQWSDEDPSIDELSEDPIDVEQLAAAVKSRKGVLAKLREASGRPRCRFEADYSKGIEAELPHLRHIVSAGKTLNAAARLAVERGESAAAVAYIEDLLALGRALREDPVLIGQLLRYVTLRLAIDVLDPDRLERSPKEWKELAEAFRIPDLQEGFVRALEYERACGVQIARGGLDAYTSGELPTTITPIIQKAGTNYLNLMTQLIELSRLPFYEARGRQERILEELSERKSFLEFLSLLLAPSVSRARANMATLESRLLIVRTVCDLKAKGEYPDRLEVADPLTGRPFVYRREGGGFHLYSVGVNGKDDAGEEDEFGDEKDDFGIRVTK